MALENWSYNEYIVVRFDRRTRNPRNAGLRSARPERADGNALTARLADIFTVLDAALRAVSHQARDFEREWHAAWPAVATGLASESSPQNRVCAIEDPEFDSKFIWSCPIVQW
jgi:hypothetical protein